FPAILAGIVGAMVPRRQGVKERLGLGLLSFFVVLGVQALWPAEAAPAEAAGAEWPSLLNVLIGLPIVGGVAILFLPRQMLSLPRGVTLGLMALVFALSLELLRTPMTRGWHYQYIKDWIPAFGIRYHVAVDGISLWLVLLTTLITPIAAYASFGSI